MNTLHLSRLSLRRDASLAFGNSAEPVHNDVAAFRATFFILASHHGIGTKRECKAMPLLEDRSKYLALNVEQPMRIVRQAGR